MVNNGIQMSFSVVRLASEKKALPFLIISVAPNLICPCFILKNRLIYGRVGALIIDEKITCVLPDTPAPFTFIKDNSRIPHI